MATSTITHHEPLPLLDYAPEVPTPVAEIVAALRHVDALDGLSDAELTWLAQHGRERKVPAGAMLFREGDPPLGMNVMLEGEVHIRRSQSGNLTFFIARMGQMSGVLPFSKMKGYGGTGYAVGNVWTLDIPKGCFDEMLAAIPSMAQRCVSVLLTRVREVTRMEMQAEKLTALGKLAANLAHELNNPASAAQRSAASLFNELREYGDRKFRLGAITHNTGTCDALHLWISDTRANMSDYLKRAEPASPLAEVDREAAIFSWLERHAVPNAWEIAPVIAETSIPITFLDEFASRFPDEVIAPAMATLASSIRVERMAETVVNSTVRIFDFISAIKDYSYMDLAPIQEIDVAQSLERTLTMFASRLAGITIERDYAPDLPHISAYGSELNQVWTELIANAIDAMTENETDPHGTLRLTTTHLGEMICVEVRNSGPAIPPENLNRIFEPFYTTKQPGKGIGLGLDTVQRIIQKHSGSVTVQSAEGATCFQVRVPIERTGAY
jgi:signal transduction histidine kinase